MPNPGIFPGAAALMPQQAERTESNWSPRDYWVQPPQRIPPKPAFEAWVPPSETIAFGELPRDTSRFQVLQGQAAANLAPVPPIPPTARDGMPQQFLRKESDWTLRDYSPNRDTFSILATPLLPPVIGSSLLYGRDMQTWAPWAQRDYSAFQAMSAWFESRTVVNVIPPNDFIVFGELPPDQTAVQLAASLRLVPPSPAIGIPPPQSTQPRFDIRPYDLTAHYLVLTTSVAQAGIPEVPIGSAFAAFDYEPIDQTPYLLVFSKILPPTPPPQIPPTYPPFIEWPGWQWGQYQVLQDQFSALATPVPHLYPKGLVPQFTPEALIRDVSHPTSLYTVQNLILPPPPPRVFPSPPTFLEWRQWAANEYPLFADQFSALASLVPPPTPFLVQAVTSGYYNGLYLQPGDVFMLLKASDFSDSTVNYGPLSGTTQYGWMKRVPANTPVYYSETQQTPPNWPIVDPVPPKRFVY